MDIPFNRLPSVPIIAMKLPRKLLTGLFGVVLALLSIGAVQGQIFVLNTQDETIGEYRFDGTRVKAALITGLKGPFAFAQAKDKLFVTNSETGSVDEYSTDGEVVRLAIISGFSPTGIAASGTNLFVLNSQAGTIGEYQLDGTVVNAALISGLKDAPIALVVSGSNLFVLNYGLSSDTGTIAEYTTAGTLMNASLVSGLHGPHAFAISGQNLFVVNTVTGTIGEYTTSGVPVNAALVSKLQGPLSIAVAGSNILLTTSTGLIEAFTMAGDRVSDALVSGLGLPVGIVAVQSGFQSPTIPQQAKPTQTEEANSQPPVVILSPLPHINLPPVIIDSQNYGTENNWLAHHIALRMVTLCYLVLHPKAKSVPDFKIEAQVDAKVQSVHLKIENFSEVPITVDLKPDFVWDPVGYTPLASKLLGSSVKPSLNKADNAPNLLGELLTLTGPELARADVSLSAQLQQQPAWVSGHEQAALVLVGLALRDRASVYTDYRQILCRATAHLAVARALSQDQVLSRAGDIADVGIRTLSGREVDALAKLDTLAARADSVGNVKTWISALRLRATCDWRSVPVTVDSPLLLKIVLAHVLAEDFGALGAERRLGVLGPLPEVPDWGRCALTNMVMGSVETGNTFAKQTPPLELSELDEILKIEQSPTIDATEMGSNFTQSLQEKVFSVEPASLHIIGPDMFRDVTRRHLLHEIYMTSDWLTNLLGVPDEAKTYRDSTLADYAGARLFETVDFASDKDGRNFVKKFKRLSKDHKNWEPWELPMGNIPNCSQLIYPDLHTLHAFYADGLPFGTAYELYYREPSLVCAHLLEDDKHPEVYHDPNPDVSKADGDVLRKLAPSSFTALTLGTLPQDVIQSSKPLWDYNLQPVYLIENRYQGFLGDGEVYGEFMRKHAALEPDEYFKLGAWLRHKGKIDEAAEADRKGFDQAFDQVGMSASVGPLVDYYFDHGRKEEAEMVAKRAADVYSYEGLQTYANLLEKMGRLDEAEKYAQAGNDRYDNPFALAELYAAHQDYFHDHMIKTFFSNGMEKVDINSLKNTPPASGCRFTSDSTYLSNAKLKPWDVVVGFDSYRIESEGQYLIVRSLSNDPEMDLIIWRKDQYIEVKASAPNRKFDVELETYKP